ncbi:DNA repair and recombination protein RAD54 [Acrasis kona]|uniref:DNA repair and recombination protein RAD54 n=1 Tax=Acrasis kona TaxID=1008807 RepID=A0AAW2YQI6_9EUKA
MSSATRKPFVSPVVNKPFKSPVIKPKGTTSKDEEKLKEKPKETKDATSSTTETTKKAFVSPAAAKNPTFKPPTTSKPVAKTKSAAKEEKVEVEGEPSEFLSIWNVMYAKRSNKKHKSYDDGILLVKEKRYILHDTSGKVVVQKIVSKTIDNLREGDVVEIGAKEVEFMSKIKEEDYISGKVFLQFQTPVVATKAKPKASKMTATKFKAHDPNQVISEVVREETKTKAPDGTILLNPGHSDDLHDVYIDYFLAKSLRDHQVEGVKFMYQCVMGERSFQGRGCLLADEMGLGKTLQSISIMWTLLNRGPNGHPIAKKCIIVTNSSLVNNWKNEVKKWLGMRLTPLVCVAKSGKLTPTQTLAEFKSGYHKCLIISYDLCSRYSEELQACKCDLLICDEAHKLKNNNIKIFQALKNLNTPRRIALSGTPMQNDLGEFFCIVDFINPGLLGEANTFKSLFTDPINKSREPDAKPETKRTGLARNQKLNELVSEFVLRRTQELLTKHLPPKTEMLVFCKLNQLQEKLYKHFVKSKYMYQLLSSGEKSGKGRHALSCIQNLKKLLTHPDMIYNALVKDDTVDSDDEEDEDYDRRERLKETWAGALELFPSDYNSKVFDSHLSGKMQLLEKILHESHKKGDKVVVVSNFTSILNQIERLCKKSDFEFVRLDGSTPSDKRMPIVDAFNSNKNNEFIFLLSSKAGGTGLNLIGANRLILFDPDWNPSNDHQAMARVWRDGQKKSVFIYRFMCTGTIEEKIFQRQIVKTGLSKTVVDDKSMNKAAFSREELKALFGYNEETKCDTFGDEADDVNVYELVRGVDDVLSKAVVDNNLVSFVKISNSKEEDAAILKNSINTNDAEEVVDVDGEEDKEMSDDQDAKSDGAQSEGEEYSFEQEETPKKKRKIEEASDDSDSD